MLSQKVPPNSVPDIILSPQGEGKMRRKGKFSPHPTQQIKQSFVESKVRIKKSNNMIYLGLLPESVRVLAKKQETVSEMFERQRFMPALIHKVT